MISRIIITLLFGVFLCLTGCSDANVTRQENPPINSNIIQETEYSGDDYSDASIDTAGDNIVITYEKNSAYYLNINGKKSEPYEVPIQDGQHLVMTFVTDSLIGFRFKVDGHWFAQIEDKIYGPYDDLMNLTLDGSSWGYIFVDDGMYYNINDEILGPFEYYPAEIFLSANSYGFHYKQDSQSYIKTKNDTYGPYGSAGISLFDDTHEVYDFELDGNWSTSVDGEIIEGLVSIKESSNYLMQLITLDDSYSIIIEGKQYGPYENIYNLGVGENVWAFAYFENDQAFIQTNTEKYGPFEIGKNDLTKVGMVDFSLGDNLIAIREPLDSGLVSIKINGKEQGPHDTDYVIGFSGDNWFYVFRKGDKNYLNYNGEYYPFKGKYAHVEHNGNNWAFVDRTDTEVSYIVNGIQYGPFESTTHFALLDSHWAEVKKVDGDYEIVRHQYE